MKFNTKALASRDRAFVKLLKATPLSLTGLCSDAFAYTTNPTRQRSYIADALEEEFTDMLIEIVDCLDDGEREPDIDGESLINHFIREPKFDCVAKLMHDQYTQRKRDGR